MKPTEPKHAKNPRKHHFLPVSYLRNFCSDDGCLYVYERGRPIRKSIPSTEAHIRDFYAFDAEGGKNFDFERTLSVHESEVAHVIQGILAREKSKERRLLTDSETETLRQFIGLMFTRVPAGREFDEKYAGPAARKLLTEAAQDPQKFATLVGDIPDEESTSDEEHAKAIEDARQRIVGGFYNLPERPGWRLGAMLHTASMIADELRQRSCVIIVSKHESFITGDTPVVTVTEENGLGQLGTSFASKDSAVWFPIANKVCLLLRRGIEPGYGRLPPRGVRGVNRNLMRYTQRFIYSSSHSTKIADQFNRIQQEIFLGRNAFIPMWDGKPL